MSTFSDTILAHKYLNKDLGETSWDDVARRVAWEVVGKNYPRAYKEVYQIIKDKKFIPGGRYLYAAGRPYHQTQNCFAAETRVPFYENSQFCVKTALIKDLVGKPDLVIMTTGGKWTQAEIKSFGVQKLSKITLQRQINIYMISDGGTLETYEEKVIYATPGHSWRVRAVNTDTNEVKKQEVQTKHLKPKMELWDVYDRAHRWTVMSVEKTDREEEVFCAVVENTREFVIEGDILTGNCLLLDVEDTRQAWADLSRRSVEGLSTGAGIGVVYSKIRPNGSPIRGMGGKATGPIALMQMINELGRHIQQGGSRRSALWAGLHWNHADVHDFIALKNWIPEVRALKEQDFNFPAPMDGTNISVILDDDFFKAYHDTNNPQHVHAQDVYKKVVKSMLKTAEPGFSVDVGKNAGEHLRNAPVTADTYVLTKQGYKKVRNIVNTPTELWTGKQWAVATFTKTGENVPVVRVEMTGGRVIRCDPSHEFFVNVFSLENARRKFSNVIKVRAQDLEPDMVLHTSLPPAHNEQQVDRDAYTLGYLYADGVFAKNSAYVHVSCDNDNAARLYTNLLVSSRYKSAKVISEKGLAKVTYKSDTEYWSGRKKTIFPEEVYTYSTDQIVSFLAGLFDGAGVFNADQARVRLVSKDKTFLRSIARLLEQVGIFAGVGKSGYSKTGMQRWCLNIMHDYLSAFVTTIPCQIFKPDVSEYESYRASDIRVLSVTEDGAEDVFCCDVGVPEHSFMAEGVIISNCTEVTSADDSDICNIASINLARIETLDEFKHVVNLAMIFLLCGTLYSKVPFAEVAATREKNRRLGLGLMGMHEWLLVRGKKYGPDPELATWLEHYATSTDIAAGYADELGISRSVKTRAIAPTGTISIIAETTSGIEPLFCSAFKRRYLKGNTWHYQYVIDATAQRIIERGVDPDSIEDAYSLANDVKRRLAFQSFVQQYVDHGISSTINLPAWGSDLNNETQVDSFADMLMKYLPTLRGITTYPDGARGGQPLVAVPYREALGQTGTEFIEYGNENACVGGVCGI